MNKEQLKRYYRQLFGYGWWGTLWRLAVVLCVTHLINKRTLRKNNEETL